MPDTLLQVWGGSFYLLAKVFFWCSERKHKNRRGWRIAAWTSFLIGLPAWMILLVPKHNWIIISVETGGSPSILLGLIIAIRGIGQEPKWLDFVAKGATILGIAFSLYDFGGLVALTQLLELGTATGFLVGTYLLARERPAGYLWFVLMHLSTAGLMYVQNFPWLVAQQLVSLYFISDAYRVQCRRKNAT